MISGQGVFQFGIFLSIVLSESRFTFASWPSLSNSNPFFMTLSIQDFCYCPSLPIFYSNFSFNCIRLSFYPFDQIVTTFFPFYFWKGIVFFIEFDSVPVFFQWPFFRQYLLINYFQFCCRACQPMYFCNFSFASIVVVVVLLLLLVLLRISSLRVFHIR